LDAHGRFLSWNASAVRWRTSDGEKPADHSEECGALSAFANALDVDCERAIVLAFVAGFAVLLAILLLIFYVLKRRYFTVVDAIFRLFRRASLTS